MAKTLDGTITGFKWSLLMNLGEMAELETLTIKEDGTDQLVSKKLNTQT